MALHVHNTDRCYRHLVIIILLITKLHVVEEFKLKFDYSLQGFGKNGTHFKIYFCSQKMTSDSIIFNWLTDHHTCRSRKKM